MWEAASRCRSPDTCSFQRPPWCIRQNTSTPPHPRTGTLPPAPPHWPHGGGGHRTPLYRTAQLEGRTSHSLHVLCLLGLNDLSLKALTGLQLAAFKVNEQIKLVFVQTGNFTSTDCTNLQTHRIVLSAVQEVTCRTTLSLLGNKTNNSNNQDSVM